ncbi:MAG: hypothetical protein VB877_15600 [Pirellulaceae bacterium]
MMAAAKKTNQPGVNGSHCGKASWDLLREAGTAVAFLATGSRVTLDLPGPDYSGRRATAVFGKTPR